MKNDLTCGVVRDLLPSYVEGLLGEESREAVERHLSDCPDCSARRDAMTVPEVSGPEAAKEVDYLKRVKKRGRFRVALAVLITCTALIAAAALKIFVIGTPLQGQSVYCEAAEEDGVLHVRIASYGSGDALHGWTVETKDGVACVSARDVLAGVYKNGGGSVDIPISGVREVWVGGMSGKLVWQDGMVISQLCLDLLDAKTPYCGNPAALGQIAEILRLQERLGGYTTTLKTSGRPYRWTLELENQLNREQLDYMVRAEYLTLALVDNLDEVSYKFPDGSGGSMPLEAAARGVKHLTEEYNRVTFKSRSREYWTAKASVKDYTRTPADFQKLLNILELL